MNQFEMMLPLLLIFLLLITTEALLEKKIAGKTTISSTKDVGIMIH